MTKIQSDYIIDCISSLKNGKFSAHDLMNTGLGKSICYLITLVLACLFSKSITVGSFPNDLKVVKIVYIFITSWSDEISS